MLLQQSFNIFLYFFFWLATRTTFFFKKEYYNRDTKTLLTVSAFGFYRYRKNIAVDFECGNNERNHMFPHVRPRARA